MTRERAQELEKKLQRGLVKSQEIFASLSAEQWERPIFEDSKSWRAKELIAHFVYSEENLLSIAKDIVAGGKGSPEGIDIDTFNADEMKRMQLFSVGQLRKMLAEVRQRTIAWLDDQDDQILDQIGRHPTLGMTDVETVIFSIYAHQLLHMREILPRLRKA